MSELQRVTASILDKSGKLDKASLIEYITKEFSFTQDRSVFFSKALAIRFSTSGSQCFSNTVLSLSNLKKFDHLPFIVCLVTPSQNFLFLANTTFLKKISHSSHQLSLTNIKGSFNGSDIIREFDGIENCASNLSKLFTIHKEIGFEGNFERLVQETRSISPTNNSLDREEINETVLLEAPNRARAFINSDDFSVLRSDLDSRVQRYKNEIVIAGYIENINIRGRVIEYLISGEGDLLHEQVLRSLKNKTQLPSIKLKHSLGDYHKSFPIFNTATDVKTKVLLLNSNPKAYNIDKMIKFLSDDKTVFLFFFVGIGDRNNIETVLVSIFQNQLLDATVCLKHWAGRGSRGVTQFFGDAINELILKPDNEIDVNKSKIFLKKLLTL